MPVRTKGALAFPLLVIEKHNTFSFWHRLPFQYQYLSKYILLSLFYDHPLDHLYQPQPPETKLLIRPKQDQNVHYLHNHLISCSPPCIRTGCTCSWSTCTGFPQSSRSLRINRIIVITMLKKMGFYDNRWLPLFHLLNLVCNVGSTVRSMKSMASIQLCCFICFSRLSL